MCLGPPAGCVCRSSVLVTLPTVINLYGPEDGVFHFCLSLFSGKEESSKYQDGETTQ